MKTIYYISRPKITRVKKHKGGKLIVRWKKNKKASGYQIQYRTGKKIKYFSAWSKTKTF